MTGPVVLLDPEDDPPRIAALLAFDEVYASNAASVYRFCLSQVADAEAAADLTQDAFKAFAAYERVRPDSASVRTWLVSLARNCCIDRHRQHRRWHLLFRHLQQSRNRPMDVEELAHDRAEHRRVNAAIGTLNGRDRELIGLRVAADTIPGRLDTHLASTQTRLTGANRCLASVVQSWKAPFSTLQVRDSPWPTRLFGPTRSASWMEERR